jgi:hypothetical protein
MTEAERNLLITMARVLRAQVSGTHVHYQIKARDLDQLNTALATVEQQPQPPALSR